MRKINLIFSLLLLAAPLFAQEEDEKKSDWKVTLSGSVQSDVLVPQEDQSIGTGTYDEWALTNTYGELRLRAGNYIEAGARLEFTQYPLPGFEKDFKGWGVPNAYITGRFKDNELTLGSFYDQFGSGLIFRTYEERSLGIDNSLMGGRFVTHAIKGVNFKVLYGKQRRYWNWNKAWVWGADLELNIQDWVKPMQEKGWNLMVGGSFVSKHEDEASGVTVTETQEIDGLPTIVSKELNVPKNVGAFDVRANLSKGDYNFLVEYAQQGQDPSFDNDYIFRKGKTLLLSGSYSTRGASVLLQAKRSEDMSFRSRRAMNGTSSFINHLPAFAYQHTYALAALYPYATQMAGGEWAFQGEFAYTFKKKTALGGRYGTSLKLNMSHIRSLRWDDAIAGMTATGLAGTEGRELKGWGLGSDLYYQDINLTMEKKLSKKVKLTLMYMHQLYNKDVVEGHGGELKSNIGVAEVKWNISRKVALRAEAQYMHSEQRHDAEWEQDWGKDWIYGLVEVSWLPYLMFTLSDQYNARVLDTTTGERKHQHYYMGQVTFTKGAHRLMVGYGKTRAGYNCSGGVCRWVPASKGCTISYNFSF